MHLSIRSTSHATYLPFLSFYEWQKYLNITYKTTKKTWSTKLFNTKWIYGSLLSGLLRGDTNYIRALFAVWFGSKERSGILRRYKVPSDTSTPQERRFRSTWIKHTLVTERADRTDRAASVPLF